MERPVGDKFKLNGCVYVVVEDVPRRWGSGCEECAFLADFCMRLMDIRGSCTIGSRTDMKDVHFEHFGVDF